MLGLDAATWTAIGTIVLAIATAALVVVTAVYVVLTRRVARSAAASADSSREAADATRVAAEAMRQSAAIAEAALSVDFDVEYFQIHVTDEEISRNLSLVCRGAAVYVHGLEVSSASYIQRAGEKEIEWIEGKHLKPRERPPVRLHRGAFTHFAWPYGGFDLSGEKSVTVSVEYSVEREGERRTLGKDVTFLEA